MGNNKYADHQTNKIINKISDQLSDKLTTAKVNKPTIKNFVSCFYANTTMEMLSTLSEEQIIHRLNSLWEFFYINNALPCNFRVFKETFCNDSKPKVVIDFFGHNMAFLLDSIRMLLYRMGLKPRITFHPILQVTRNKDGTIQTISIPSNTKHASDLESIIHFEIHEDITDKTLQTISKELAKTLQDIEWANQDWEIMRTKTSQTMQELEQSTTSLTLSNNEKKEIISFLNWINNDHYTFLGYCNYDFIIENEPGKIAKPAQNDPNLGILKNKGLKTMRSIFKGIPASEKTTKYLTEKFPVVINKSSILSRVHRNTNMDCIGIKRYDNNGKVIGIKIFIGLFTSVAYSSSVRDIPLLRSKIKTIVKESGFTNDWHDGKALIHILDSLPRDELFQASVAELKKIAISILHLQETPRIAFFVRKDKFSRFLSCLVYIPQDRFDTALCKKISTILEHYFDGNVGTYKAQFGSIPFARVHYTVEPKQAIKKDYNITTIEEQIISAASNWSDKLDIALHDICAKEDINLLYKRYENAFEHGYKAKYIGKYSVADIIEIEKMYELNDNFRVRVYSDQDTESSSLKLKIYNRFNSLPLSDVLPILENLDLKVMSEVPYKVSALSCDEVWIHDFGLESRGDCIIDLAKACDYFKETLIKVHHQEVENDGFNRLVIRANLHTRQCILFRAYAKYLRLTGLPFNRAYISDTLVKNPRIVQLLASLFAARLQHNDTDQANKIEQSINASLENISNADEDRVLRLYLKIIKATVRTNMYQPDTNGNEKNYISFKISSQELDFLPAPKPLYEIFVYSSFMEAIHLRGGKVARGGIRWSDRQEDFRTEILGLLKAQMVKNTVIVPVGSKGGFIVKHPTTNMSREETINMGIHCYQTMIKGMLDLTDNLIDNNITSPANVIRLDQNDPYLVVAADKGTATFSDYANDIAKQYNFWLDDAFASGGSVGYDHKKMAITAKGAWESVKRHFRELGKNIQQEHFHVIGVGDMSGDVFGNGMLLSEQIKLIAAFNHIHIFIDPDPDTVTSYKERKRLFAKSRSTWEDYDTNVLSKGGAIYSRNAKTIIINDTIKKMFALQSSTITPDELVKKILTHKTNLLWFGGIGTYIKSSIESHSDVGDRMNDNVRVNAKDLQAEVIGEGANLGCTQLARIEFERKQGGYINTDAIDNSAGVSCSDREVNIKILLNDIMNKHDMSFAKRNKLLESMTNDVSDLVLEDNYAQSQTITMIRELGHKNFDQQINLIRTLENDGILNRQIEFLPDDSMLEEYQNSQTCLTRPEISTLLGYSKISFYDRILNSSIAKDPFFNKYLKQYFPYALQRNYHQEILNHPLKQEIIATYAINKIINKMGASYILEATHYTGADVDKVIHAFFTITTVFNLEPLWQDIDKLDNQISEANKISILLDLHTILKRTNIWLLKYYPMHRTIEETINALCSGVEIFLANINNALDEKGKAKLDDMVKYYENMNLDNSLAKRIAFLKIASTSPDIILIASETGYHVSKVAELYFQIGELFNFSLLKDIITTKSNTSSRWDRRLTNCLLEELFNYQSDLTISILQYIQKFNIKVEDNFTIALNDWSNAHSNNIKNLNSAITESQIESNFNLTAMDVIIRELRHLSGN